MCAPRKSYRISYESIIKKGNSKVLEIPISALLFLFIGTIIQKWNIIKITGWLRITKK
ncbi:MAG: hypothetical protein ACE5J3_09560 [Methanosarcinales archaeon]